MAKTSSKKASGKQSESTLVETKKNRVKKTAKKQSDETQKLRAWSSQGVMQSADEPVESKSLAAIEQQGAPAKKKKKTVKSRAPMWKRSLAWIGNLLWGNKWKRIVVMSLVFSVVLISAFWWLILKDLPSPNKLDNNPYDISTQIFDRNGNMLYEIYADQNRTPVEIEFLPDYLIQATVATEDKDFYKHQGLAVIGIIRAMGSNVKYLVCEAVPFLSCTANLQGGSTITQQLVKNTLLSPERTIQRKVKELILSLVIEGSYSKDEILEMYLNQIPYGGTAYGIESASQTYFGKSAYELNLAESSILAGLSQAPSRYSPFGSDPKAYKVRQQGVLRRMVEDGYITQEQADEAYATEVQFGEPANLINAPHFVLWVKELLEDKYGPSLVETGGLRVVTSLDLTLQEEAQRLVSEQVDKLERSKVSNGAAVVTNPSTGEVLAMVGSANYFDTEIDGNVNVTLAYRQPGSSIKPLNYTLAFDQFDLSPGQIIGDVPTCFISAGTTPYCPQNFNGGFSGAVTIREALARSLNIPAVKLLAMNGVDTFMYSAKDMGITGWDDPSKYGLSLTLGGGEVRMVDMAVAYSNIANVGIKVPLHPILGVTDFKSNTLMEFNCQAPAPEELTKFDADLAFSADCEAVRTFDPKPIYMTRNILTDQSARAAVFGSALNVSGHPELGVKTGTTNDFRDSWTVGFTHNRLAVVWMGNNDNSEMSYTVSGSTGAGPVMKGIMTAALADQEVVEIPPPEGVIGMNVCSLTGGIATEECPGQFDLYLEDNVPTEARTLKRPWPIDKTTGGPAQPDTLPENIEMQEKQIAFDILGQPICLDCPLETQKQTLSYPLEWDVTSGVNVQPELKGE